MRDEEVKRGSIGKFMRRTLGSYSTLNWKHIKPRKSSKKLTDTEAFINLIKCVFGTGCLAMPRAFYNAGWLVGLISTVLLSSFVIYAMHVLLNDINTLCKRLRLSRLNYSESMGLAMNFGPDWLQPLRRPMSYLVDIFLSVYHFGVDCVYVVFIAKNLKVLGDIYLINVDLRIYMALLTFPLILTFLVRDLKYLVPYALISNVLIISSFMVILCYLFRDLPSLKTRQATQELSQIPLFFGTVLFAIESVGVIQALQQNMEHPENYLGKFGILNRGMSIVIVLYTTFGFFGYWKYGENTAGSILSNLPRNQLLTNCVFAMFAVGIFFSYSLQGFVTIDIIWRQYLEPLLEDSDDNTIEYLLRTAFVIASVLVAMGYPDFGLLLSFVGSFCLAQLGLIYPGIINLCLWYNYGYGTLNFILWRSLLFIIVGVVGGILGTMASVTGLTEIYVKNATRFS